MNKTTEALKMAIKALLTGHHHADLCDEAIKACKEALESQEQENEASSLREPVAWMKSAIDNARDVCKYLDHNMIDEAKAHTQFFWNDLDKIREAENALSNSDTI